MCFPTFMHFRISSAGQREITKRKSTSLGGTPSELPLTEEIRRDIPEEIRSNRPEVEHLTIHMMEAWWRTYIWQLAINIIAFNTYTLRWNSCCHKKPPKSPSRLVRTVQTMTQDDSGRSGMEKHVSRRPKLNSGRSSFVTFSKGRLASYKSLSQEKKGISRRRDEFFFVSWILDRLGSARIGRAGLGWARLCFRSTRTPHQNPPPEPSTRTPRPIRY